MSNFNKVYAIDGEIANKKDILGLSKVKISKVIKFNLSISYFIALTFLLIKLFFT